MKMLWHICQSKIRKWLVEIPSVLYLHRGRYGCIFDLIVGTTIFIQEIVESQHLPSKRKLEYTPAKDEKKACTENNSSISFKLEGIMNIIYFVFEMITNILQNITIKCQNLPAANMQYDNTVILSQIRYVRKCVHKF